MGDNVRGGSIHTRRRSHYTAKPPSPVVRPPQFTINSASDPSLDLSLTATLPLPSNPSIADVPDSDSGGGNCTAAPPLSPNLSIADAPDSDFDWFYCTEEQLEDTILQILDLIYNDALIHLIFIGYDESTARHAMLCNGYCYGSDDVLSNILNNVIYFLNSPPIYKDLPTSYAFTTFRQLEEYCLSIMLTILQQVRPHLTRCDAMWCLFMSDLHVGRASTLQIPGSCVAEDADNSDKIVTYCSRHRRPEPSNYDIVGSVLKSLEIMNIEETPNVSGTEEQKKKMILDLVRKIRELVMRVRLHEVCVQQNALQASQKVSSDQTEFNTLRAEWEENQQEKKGRPRLEDSMIKQLSDMEAALKRASVEVDQANSVIGKLDTENAKMWVEMEASKLSVSESAKLQQEVYKREKGHKRLQALEKQMDKLKEDIIKGMKIIEVDPELNEVLESNKRAEDAENANELAAYCPRQWWHSTSSPELLNSDSFDSMLKSLESMSIEEAPNVAGIKEQKKEMILGLVRKARELEVQVSEQKEWAQRKVLQVALKESSHLVELNILRAKREENQLEKKGKLGLDDSMMKRMLDMEAMLKRASEEIDRANSVVRKYETENAEMRAEIEASKLCASESIKMHREVEKREKKCLKRLQARDKQRDKLKEDIAEERRKIAEAEQELNRVLDSNKQVEMRLRKAIEAKELAIAQVEEEQRAKEATEIRIKRNHELLQQKIELDLQRHKDDVRRLEEELSRLKASTTLSSVEGNALKTQKEANSKMEPSTSKKNGSRKCVICMQEEVCVVLLPCAHQVICARCNEKHEKKGKATCPLCNVMIEERIRVYGANS